MKSFIVQIRIYDNYTHEREQIDSVLYSSNDNDESAPAFLQRGIIPHEGSSIKVTPHKMKVGTLAHVKWLFVYKVKYDFVDDWIIIDCVEDSDQIHM